MVRTKAAASKAPVTLLSIQGEQQAAKRATLFASVEDADRFIDTLPEQFMRCRLKGHWFEAYTVERDRRAKTALVVERCDCGTERAELLNGVTGHVIEPRHITHYAEGYLAPAGTGRIVGEAKNLLRVRFSIERAERIIAQRQAASVTPIKRTRRKASAS